VMSDPRFEGLVLITDRLSGHHDWSS
jgi:hypothetical protein